MPLTGTLTRLGIKTFDDSDAPDLFNDPGGLTEILNQVDALFGLVPIRDVTVNPAASVTLSSIPATYKHLLLLWQAAANGAAEQNLQLRFNGDTGANYSYQLLELLNNAANNGGGAGASLIVVGTVGTNAPAMYGGAIIIPNYTGGFPKQAVGIYGGHATNQRVGVDGGRWTGTAAINEIALNAGGGSFLVGSRFTLFGLL